MLVPWPQQMLGAAGWVVTLQRGALAAHIWEGAAPQLCSRPPHHRPGPSITRAPAVRGLSVGWPSWQGPGLDTPPAHPVLSVNFWVNCVSPRDLSFNPDKHESVNWASEGARGL